ncbi:alpha-1,3-mannosyl-glycoprotein 4-beta-N-acetylglucosaminyltransferase C [Etheostoma cragini]|uniref:alpha-1,3-mannosyl-glycoprotein 4-beta-N-acetylglucosaminyltransferase C n=1 Tax=Etheostoma cragini TaxID=417921 RepID=UPI00155E9AC7|nr:alpha-1,3-mannosyl-glycoprotein 4-beta-N-acetylglucosaminyltransferase C [Etheostoma cragini]
MAHRIRNGNPSESLYSMRLLWKSLDKMRCLRKRSTIPFLGFLITFLLFLNLYIEDGYVLEGDKRQLRETSVHPSSSERYVHTFRDLSNFSGSINVTYRYLAGTPLNRKKYLTIGLSSVKRKRGNYLLETIKSIFDQSSYEELKEIVVVVHLADFDLVWCENLVQEITRKFAHHIIAGHINVFENYDATKAYSTVDEYFWGKPPTTGDFFVIVFNKSTKISKIKIATGSDDRQNDILHHGALEVGEKLVGTKKGKQCSSYITLGEFKNGNVEVQDVDHKIAFNIECVRIVVTASQKEWLIIRSISLWTTQPPSQ